jgi:hypothetical protein
MHEAAMRRRGGNANPLPPSERSPPLWRDALRASGSRGGRYLNRKDVARRIAVSGGSRSNHECGEKARTAIRLLLTRIRNTPATAAAVRRRA